MGRTLSSVGALGGGPLLISWLIKQNRVFDTYTVRGVLLFAIRGTKPPCQRYTVRGVLFAMVNDGQTLFIAIAVFWANSRLEGCGEEERSFPAVNCGLFKEFCRSLESFSNKLTAFLRVWLAYIGEEGCISVRQLSFIGE